MQSRPPKLPDSQYSRKSSGSFFGRRKGQKLSPSRQALFDGLLPKLKVDPESDKPETVSEWAAGKTINLEIGFGGGEHLIHQARTHAEACFIGVEPFVNSLGKALKSIDELGLENIRLYDDDAIRLLDWLPDNSISRIDLLYPDPWPKKRHWKRRFVNQENLSRFSRILKPGGLFRFASDIDTYVNWTLCHCHLHPSFQWTACQADDWRKPWEGWSSTRYEAKALREGRTPCYLVFKCIN